MTEEALRSLDRMTLRERALVALREAILTGRYGPGDHLGEVEIASQLSISRGTVREALRHLQQEGLVTPGVRGMLRVRSLSAAEIDELFRVRCALEGQAVAEIVESDGLPQIVTELNASLDKLEAATGDLAEQLEADLAFHAQLCALSGNSILLDTWRHLEGPIRVVVMSASTENRRFPMSAGHHRPIVEAIERGDAETAVRVLREHMKSAVERLNSKV
ncbi:GntR family transcriptional regulator [Saccharopolyspora sp. TS4A08]|uniref:GntR family transcriptional regulator n=1 Tax=Saccharopolyspora ipomoeae TaxID=3042027 RepID=A0ABT6PMT4_9PSEU|nr:GntR family transcriptional regulator [Saccharopolyspora sp. TS4A08]MDI2029316.1 GntR family transcriptional regulator [Saccharopolyspora sp. TS4A08]